MTASEIVTAYEAGIITQDEATEQGLVETLNDLYARLSTERSVSRGRERLESRRQH